MDIRARIGIRASIGAVAAAAVAVTLATTADAQAATGITVKVTNSGYTPATATIPYGGKVTWNVTSGTHTVTDSSRMHLFDSGAKKAGSSYAFTFTDAGTYAYHSTVGTAMSGKVVVPMTVKPATGTRTTYFAVQWGSTYTRSGYLEQVQLKVPGSTKWISFVYGTPVKDATMRAADWGNKTGKYQFRARLYKDPNQSVSSGWSPVASVTVH